MSSGIRDGGSPSSSSSSSSSLPRRRFGRTGLMMPVLSCGGMRYQMTHSTPDGYSMSDVDPDCQRNLEDCIAASYRRGIDHFETARGYGSSELQLGRALKRHMDDGLFTREDFILQTKCPISPDAGRFRGTLEKSLFRELDIHGNGLGHVDLLAFHGINSPRKLDMVLREGGCMDVIDEYRKRGLVRFVGFSTHGMEPLITKACKTGRFDYVNLHYHFIGSYTASGSGGTGSNLAAIRAAREQDMGVFIISPTDKGGYLYRPPRRFADLTAPLTPIEFNNLWLLSQHPDDIHTLVVGAARPSDFDEHVRSVARLGDASTAGLVRTIAERLHAAYRDALSPRWRTSMSWWRGLPDAYGNVDGTPGGDLVDVSNNPHCVNYAVIVWLYGICHAWGFHAYARDRYGGLVGNGNSLRKFLESGRGTVRDYVEGGTMNDYGPGCDPRDGLSREDLLRPLSGTADAGGLHPDEIWEALSFARRCLHPSTPAPDEPVLNDLRPDACWPDRPKSKKRKPSTDHTCGGVRPPWMASAHETIATVLSSMEEKEEEDEDVKKKNDRAMEGVFEGPGVVRVKWFGSSDASSAAAVLFRRFHRDGNLGLAFRAEKVVEAVVAGEKEGATNGGGGDAPPASPSCLRETGTFGHVHRNLLSQVRRGRYSIRWGTNRKIAAFEIEYDAE